ncbi:MAG TPA: VOC family protein [Roseiarcus sp.]|nr:VOC family protein [Roseiarcus sp.]
MADSQGKFVWYELLTTDMAAAEKFYRGVLGWSAREAGAPGMSYTLFSVGEVGAAGMLTLPKAAKDMGATPHWTGYIAVDDVDAYARKVTEAGGRIYAPATDIPSIGRFAAAGDPHGADFVIFKPLPGMRAPVIAPDAVGHAGWRELMAGDLETEFAFYSKLFGWTKGDAVDMGPMGRYQLFATGGTTIGGMMTKPQSLPRPGWNYYFNVAGVNDSIAKVKAGGGKVVNGPHQVPGGSWIVQCLDPQGVMLALVSRNQ